MGKRTDKVTPQKPTAKTEERPVQHFYIGLHH